MSEKQETIADIVAEIRAAAYIQNADTPRSVLHLADRIEAAAKRDEAHAVEHATAHAEAVARSICRACIYNPQGHNYEGVNAAAMREALVAVKKSIDGIGASSLDGDPEILMMSLTQVCARLSSRIERALSAPPRNCDRFADELDAQLAFLNKVWLISVERETMLERDKFKNWSGEMKTRYGRWLFAHEEGGLANG